MRNDKILTGLNKAMKGLEIGPCHRPAASKRDGWNCISVDHTDRAGLLRKYKGHAGVNPDNIEEVDVIWRGGEIFDLFPADEKFDYIIASHVIEHMPNLIGFLLSCQKLLGEQGVLSLVVPDKRFCFDYFRPISTTGQVVQAHLERRSRHTFASIFDEKLYACNVAGEICWDRWNVNISPKMNYNLSEAFELGNQALHSNLYVDAHAWCFTPSSFRLILQDLYQLNLSMLQESNFFDTEFCEFFVQLGCSYQRAPISRSEMLMRIQNELK